MDKIKHGSFFTGIGGFDLAAEWMGWGNVLQCEIDEFCQKILKYHFPNATLFNDITKTDFRPFKGEIDIITGGFPCQPFSASGARLGKKDKRYLWPAMFRGIQEIQPTYVVAENVLGITFNGAVVLGKICNDLEIEGYEVQTIVFPASAIGAIHQRQRVWIVGFKAQNRSQRFLDAAKNKGFFANAHQITQHKQQPKTRIGKSENGQRRSNLFTDGSKSIGIPWVSEPPICGRNDGLPEKLDGISLYQFKQRCFESFGNAIAPQAAFKLFQHLPII